MKGSNAKRKRYPAKEKKIPAKREEDPADKKSGGQFILAISGGTGCLKERKIYQHIIWKVLWDGADKRMRCSSDRKQNRHIRKVRKRSGRSSSLRRTVL